MIFPWTKLKREIEVLRTDNSMLRANLHATQQGMYRALDVAYERRQALIEIEKSVTPKANATVKRMGRIATRALGK